jgi:hypothetical protein
MRIQEKAISSLETAHVATPAHLAAATPPPLLLLLSAACMLPLVLALMYLNRMSYLSNLVCPLSNAYAFK